MGKEKEIKDPATWQVIIFGKLLSFVTILGLKLATADVKGAHVRIHTRHLGAPSNRVPITGAICQMPSLEADKATIWNNRNKKTLANDE